MQNEVEGFPVLRFTKDGAIRTRKSVATESAVTIILNNQELVTLLCSPRNLDHLAVGFLYTEGILKTKIEIEKILLDERRGVVRLETKEDIDVSREVLFKRIITTGCGRGASFYSSSDAASKRIDSEMRISAHEVFTLVNKFQRSSKIYAATHGVHSAGLCDTSSILIFAEDIGRHNAIDKIFGECILKNLPITERIVITSGRISSEILHKVVKMGIPILISISVPTNLGVRLADELGITLIGFARGKRMNVYTHDWRISNDEKQ